jgi:hypothetical protein
MQLGVDYVMPRDDGRSTVLRIAHIDPKISGQYLQNMCSKLLHRDDVRANTPPPFPIPSYPVVTPDMLAVALAKDSEEQLKVLNASVAGAKRGLSDAELTTLLGGGGGSSPVQNDASTDNDDDGGELDTPTWQRQILHGYMQVEPWVARAAVVGLVGFTIARALRR